jgi:hypothetical protein
VLLSVVFVQAHPRDDLPSDSPAPSAHAACPLALSLEGMLPHRFPCAPKSFRMKTCESVSKQRTLTAFRINTCEKSTGGCPFTLPHCFFTSLLGHPMKDARPERHQGRIDASLLPSRLFVPDAFAGRKLRSGSQPPALLARPGGLAASKGEK